MDIYGASEGRGAQDQCCSGVANAHAADGAERGDARAPVARKRAETGRKCSDRSHFWAVSAAFLGQGPRALVSSRCPGLPGAKSSLKSMKSELEMVLKALKGYFVSSLGLRSRKGPFEALTKLF